MINIIYGRNNAPKGFVLDTRKYFVKRKKPEWFEHPLVKRFLMDIDGTTVLFEEALKDRYGHGISTEKISTGCKTLCSILFDTEGRTFYGSAMGNNCIPYLVEISNNYHDIYLFLEHDMLFPDELFTSGIIGSNGKPITEDDYFDMQHEWLEHGRL